MSSTKTKSLIALPLALKAWSGADFDTVIKREIATLAPDLLPLQKGLQHNNYAPGDDVSAIILHRGDEADFLSVKVGLFYSGITTGCSCADDPTPIDRNTEYCEVIFRINKHNAETVVSLIEPGTS